jgi:predicted O-linked N-acetylglucosamine transferase (SPINDLY family)
MTLPAVEQLLASALAHHQAGQLQEAEVGYRQVLDQEPGNCNALNLLGTLAYQTGHWEAAQDLISRAIKAQPDYAEAYCNLGVLQEGQARFVEAAASYRLAIEIEPGLVQAHHNLGKVLLEQGLAQEAVACFERVVAAKPDSAKDFSGLLCNLHYPSGITQATLWQRHREFNTRFAHPLSAAALPHGRSNEPARRLRIGYVSADLRDHSVSFFFEPVLAAHLREQFEVVCYSGTTRPDAVTARLREHADLWRDTPTLSDADMADLIRQDRIDILVDLSGHTLGNRLLVFARKPAPVQVSWLGYIDTTGLDAIDYGIWDAFTVPPGNERWFSEKVVRLAHGRFCYAPPDYAPEVAPLPALQRGHVTFGCFNNPAKISPETIALWAKLLHAVPHSHLLLKMTSLSDAQVRQHYLDLFSATGIATERIELRGASAHAEMLAEYGDMDIALDPFPFSGGLTSCEALWMGVPVITLPGELPASRQTLGYLSLLQLGSLAADSEESYLNNAAELGRDLDYLQLLRQTLRQKMRTSPLCDATAFTHELEQAYRQMWQTWCKNDTTNAPSI